MSVAGIGVAVEGVLLAVALVFIVALLRSHADILRRLGAVEHGAYAGEAPEVPPPGTIPTDLTARDLVGETLAGDAVKLALGAGAPRTLLTFLTSGCAACGPLWEGLRRGDRLPADTRVVVVTNGAERESPTRLSALAPVDSEVVMSTSAWRDYAVPSSPHFVLVAAGSRQILGRGAATGWEQIATLVRDAEADAAISQRARSSAERAERAEEALAAAGIGAGHPSLYPTRDDGTGGR